MRASPGPDHAEAHAPLSGRDRRWQPPARHLLAVLLLVEALLAGAFAVWPPYPPNQGLDAMLAVVLALAAVG